MTTVTKRVRNRQVVKRLEQIGQSRPPTHPGEILVNEFLPGGQSRIPGVGPQTLLDLLYGDGKITPRLARIFAREFGTSVEFWLNLQRNYDSFPWQR